MGEKKKVKKKGFKTEGLVFSLVGCGGRLLGIWVGTWGRGFRCGASVFCSSFKNAVRGTIPCQCHFLQLIDFFVT